MATKTKRPTEQKTRRLGKGQLGWVKHGHYLSPEASERLLLTSIKRGKDSSDLLNSLVLREFPAYTITVGSPDRSSPIGPVANEDRLETDAHVNLNAHQMA
jgi:hypothetical protein